MHVEPVKEYKRDLEGVRDLLGTTKFLSQASFIPTPVDTTQVRIEPAGASEIFVHCKERLY